MMMAKRAGAVSANGDGDPAGGRGESDGGDGDPTGADAAGAPIPASYERARDELASVVGRLEEGGLTLDESLALWERGQQLAAACETFLEGARERVEATLAAQQDDEDEDAD